ncbi:MAG: ABC transporter ATP-binding protein [candidate division FCPU426 bacterium]
MLDVRNLTVSVPGRRLLDSVSFSVAAGERFAIIGPNGAGKSTLLKVLCRILPQPAEAVRWQGQLSSGLAQKDLARWVAYVPQALAHTEEFAVREFVLMGRYPHLSPFSNPRRRDWEAVDQALAATGMEAFSGRTLATLSGGELQKVVLAAALAQEARVLLLDEPTAHLDPFQQDQIYALLESAHSRQNLTLLEVTHDVNRAALGHDRILGLRDGRVAFLGTPEELMRPEALREIYGKRFLLAPHPNLNRLVVLPEGGREAT